MVKIDSNKCTGCYPLVDRTVPEGTTQRSGEGNSQSGTHVLVHYVYHG